MHKNKPFQSETKHQNRKARHLGVEKKLAAETEKPKPINNWSLFDSEWVRGPAGQESMLSSSRPSAYTTLDTTETIPLPQTLLRSVSAAYCGNTIS